MPKNRPCRERKLLRPVFCAQDDKKPPAGAEQSGNCTALIFLCDKIRFFLYESQDCGKLSSM